VSEGEDSVTFTVQPLARRHKRDDFSCGIEPLDRYLKTQASQDARRGFAAPIVAVTDDNTVIAYYTLSAFTIGVGELPEEETKGFPKHPVAPATLLGRLAVEQSCRGQGIGEHMLLHALKRAYDLSSEIASYTVVVDAKNDAAAAFYQHFGFQPLPERTDRLYLPMKQLAKLF
jgi:GNAT superfamily N-acetyltransferase